MSKERRDATLALVAASVGLACVYFHYRHHIARTFRRLWNAQNPLGRRQIEVVEDIQDCQRVVGLLKSHCANFKVLGLDCEWVTVGGTRRPVAMLQLSSHTGLCALFRLCFMQQIPKGLRELLEDEEIIKVGVATHDDAQKLNYDYGVGVANTLDLRFLAVIAEHRPGGLGALSKSLLNVELEKNWRLSCSDWEAKTLTEAQLNYAANDALVGVLVFKKLQAKLAAREFKIRNLLQSKKAAFQELRKRLEPWFDRRYKDKYSDLSALKSSLQEQVKKSQPNYQPKRENSTLTRSKIMYSNCLLEAPDGELLCTIDRKKAEWYLSHDLGEETNAEPFTVRLKFEPAGRAVGDVGKYYQIPKENQCVVCGYRDAYIRKNVVPREFRKSFPAVMKAHTSHDIVLLCPRCHQLSNISDIKIRRQLAAMCDISLSGNDNARFFESSQLKSVKSAARALLKFEKKLPEGRREHLKEIVLKHFDSTELTTEMLEEASNMETTHENNVYRALGEKVVELYQKEHGGYIELEKLWRQHFLDTMQPKFLPELWSVDHNAERLTIRAQEGRVNKEDLMLAGLNHIQVNN